MVCLLHTVLLTPETSPDYKQNNERPLLKKKRPSFSLQMQECFTNPVNSLLWVESRGCAWSEKEISKQEMVGSVNELHPMNQGLGPFKNPSSAYESQLGALEIVPPISWKASERAQPCTSYVTERISVAHDPASTYQHPLEASALTFLKQIALQS